MRILLIGYGRMGRAIEAEALKRGHAIAGRIGSANRNELKEFTSDRCDMAIEFTVPHSAFEHLRYCLHAGIPVVSGTTGWQDRFDEIREYCRLKNGSMVWASNFSIGMNIVFGLNHLLAALIKGKSFTIEIEETHHLKKLDKPSGTAITLAGAFLEQGLYKGWSDEKKAGILPVISKREADVTGIHRVICESENERIELKHEAMTRAVFAEGAVMAAEWLSGKKGFYTMQDVIGLGKDLKTD